MESIELSPNKQEPNLAPHFTLHNCSILFPFGRLCLELGQHAAMPKTAVTTLVGLVQLLQNSAQTTTFEIQPYTTLHFLNLDNSGSPKYLTLRCLTNRTSTALVSNYSPVGCIKLDGTYFLFYFPYLAIVHTVYVV